MEILSLAEFFSLEEISIISFYTNFLKVEQRLDFWSPSMWVHKSKLCIDFIMSTDLCHFSPEHSLNQGRFLCKHSSRPIPVTCSQSICCNSPGPVFLPLLSACLLSQQRSCLTGVACGIHRVQPRLSLWWQINILSFCLHFSICNMKNIAVIISQAVTKMKDRNISWVS